MPAHPSQNPWPEQTPHPATPRSSLHVRDDAEPPPNDITDFDQIRKYWFCFHSYLILGQSRRNKPVKLTLETTSFHVFQLWIH